MNIKPVLATLTCALASVFAHAADQSRPDALLQIDLNRTAVIERIVSSWSTEVPSAQMASFKSKLSSLRADQLLAANLSGSFDGVLEIVHANAASSLAASRLLASHALHAGVRDSTSLETLQRTLSLTADQSKAVGEITQDLVYTPITPCNLMDTRPGITPAPPIAGPALVAGYAIRNIQVTGNCTIPAGAVAVSTQFTIENIPSLGGVVFAGKSGAAGGSAVVSWSAPITYASGASVIPISTAGQMQLQSANVTHIKVDVNGYLMPANRNGNGLRVIQTTDGLSNAPNVINGSSSNVITQFLEGSTNNETQGATVAGGGYSGTDCYDYLTDTTTRNCGNEARASFATVSGGYGNLVTGNASTIGGGYSNSTIGANATVAGGHLNTAATGSSVGGGRNNVARGSNSTVAGGFFNTASGAMSTVAGGANNTASGERSTVAGGSLNLAGGDFSFAGGRRAKVRDRSNSTTGSSEPSCAAGTNCGDEGTFVWADSTNADFISTGPNQFLMRASGGVGINTNNPNGVSLRVGTSTANGNGAFVTNGGVWTNGSSRTFKDRFAALSKADILTRVLALPVMGWHYKGTNERHIGPIAEDFHKTFGVGTDPKYISTVDASGVALAAIQGLNQKLDASNKSLIAEGKAKDAKISAMERELKAIKKKLGL